MGCASYKFTLIHILTMSFILGEMVVSFSHQSRTRIGIASGKQSVHLWHLCISQNASLWMSNKTYISTTFLMFRLSTPKILAMCLLLLLGYEEATSVHTMFSTKANLDCCTPTRWDVSPFKLIIIYWFCFKIAMSWR